jgi:hypothetical protein
MNITSGDVKHLYGVNLHEKNFPIFSYTMYAELVISHDNIIITIILTATTIIIIIIIINYARRRFRRGGVYQHVAEALRIRRFECKSELTRI